MKTIPYSATQVMLHWLSAVFILWALIMGSSVAVFDVSPEFKSMIAALNVSLSVLFIPFFVVRALLRIGYLKRHGAQADERLAGFIHNLIYAVTGVVLVTGVLMMNRPIQVFSWFTLGQPLTNPLWLHRFHTLHIVANALLGALVVLHMLAVVKHQLSGKPVLRRMLVTR